jgi:AraC-like DNA-binding protein
MNLDIALGVICLVLAIIFFVLPLPSALKGLRSYRISLNILAASYLIFVVLLFLAHVLGEPPVDLLSIVNLNISSLQALLIAMTLIILLNPGLVTFKYLLRHITPIVIFDIVYIAIAVKWGNPIISNKTELFQNWNYPPVILRALFLLFYIVQLVYLTLIFMRQTKYYASLLDDYFADEYKLRLSWVVVCFISALLLGIWGIVMMISFSESGNILFRLYCIVFYTVFGVCYIQYPRTYVKIERVMKARDSQSEAYPKITAKLCWPDLKAKIVDDKYYIRVGITIEDMAQYLQIGRTTLSGFINKEEGMNFNAWIRKLRTEEAMRIFRDKPHLSISQVSELVGYSEPSNFSRQFKIATGISPSEWYTRTHDF